MNKPHLFLIEVLFLFLIPIMFMGIYTWAYVNPVLVIPQHLYIVSLALISALAIRVLMFRHVAPKWLAWFVSSIIYSKLLYAIFIYYLIVIIGLNSWSRVTTKEFILTYIKQAQHFCEALGISYSLVIFSLILLYLLFLAISGYLLAKVKWSAKPNPISPPLISLLLISIIILCTYQFYNYLKYGSANFEINKKEPIWQTMISGKPVNQNHNANQGNSVDWHLHEKENEARSNYVPSATPSLKNLVIIVVDGLRPRNMSLYGYDRNTTPYIDKMYQDGILKKATNVRSSCGETSCGHASLLGSRYSHELPDNLFTLQEVLIKHGYEVNMIISGDHMNFYNMRSLYGNVQNYYDGSMAEGYYINDDMLTLDKTKSLPKWNGKPTMFHYHLLSAHVVGKLMDQFTLYKPYANYAGMRIGPPNHLYTNYYDNGITQSDFFIHELINTLKSKDYLDNALVIITSDHGEALGEHNLLVHTNSVREEVLHIPLAMIPYGYESTMAKDTDAFISILDIAPSILKEFEIPVPDVWTGKPLQETNNKEFTYFQMHYDAGLFDLRDPNTLWKYWINKHTGEEFAFDITRDPGEKKNLIWTLPSSQKQTWRDQVSKTYSKQ